MRRGCASRLTSATPFSLKDAWAISFIFSNSLRVSRLRGAMEFFSIEGLPCVVRCRRGNRVDFLHDARLESIDESGSG